MPIMMDMILQEAERVEAIANGYAGYWKAINKVLKFPLYNFSSVQIGTIGQLLKPDS